MRGGDPQMLGNLISASNKEEARKRGPMLLCRVGGKVSNDAWPLPRIAASRFYWERPKLPSVQTGFQTAVVGL